MINMKKTSNFNTMNNSSDPQFSGLLPISTNKKLIDFSKTSNELTIFNTSSYQKEVPFFFRRLTRTKEEVSEKDNNIYFERVFKYIKNKQNCTNETYLNSEICSPIRFEDTSYLNKIQYCIVLIQIDLNITFSIPFLINSISMKKASKVTLLFLT